MDNCIELFWELYVQDMSNRCGITNPEEGPVKALPQMIAMACLMNPMYGGMTNMVKAGLMTEEQYHNAEADLIRQMQSMRERDSDRVIVLDVSSEDDDDSACLDDAVQPETSTEQQKAREEYRVFCNTCKMQRNRPKAYEDGALKLGPLDMQRPITMGKVLVKGDDIKPTTPPFVKCNLATYIDDTGRFDLVGFFELQQDIFPTLYKLPVCMHRLFFLVSDPALYHKYGNPPYPFPISSLFYTRTPCKRSI